MMKIIFGIISLSFLFSCSSSKSQKDNSALLPSTDKKLTVLSKEYPGFFSIADSYVHLPLEEKERDAIVFGCNSGKASEITKNLFAEMKDATQIYINSYYIATCYAINKDFNRALHYYGKVYSASNDISLKSKSLTNMATIQWHWGKLRKALAYYREAYNLRPSPVILYLVASAELELGLYQKLLERKAEMLKFSFTDSYWRLLLAELSFFTSDYDKAVATYEALPDDFWKMQNRSLANYIVALFRTGRHEAAKKFVAKWKEKLLPQPSYQSAKLLFPEIKKYE